MRCTVAFLLALAACGGKAAPIARPAAQGEAGARQEARAVVDEVYRALKSGDTDDLLSLMSDDVLVLGPRPGDLQRSRAEVVTALREVIDSRRKTRFVASGVRLAIGPGGRSAYAVDRAQLGGRPVIALALLDGERAIWRVTAVHLQAPLSAGALRKAAASGALSAPAATAEPPLPEGDEPARALAANLAAVGTWVAALPDDADAVMISADGAVATGKKALARAARRLADVQLQASSPVASVTSSDGQLALATCLATRQRAAGETRQRAAGKAAGAGDAPRTVRVTAILRRAGERWQLAAFAEAHAVER